VSDSARWRIISPIDGTGRLHALHPHASPIMMRSFCRVLGVEYQLQKATARIAAAKLRFEGPE